MEQLQHSFHLFRDGQTQVGYILQEIHALVRDIEKDNCRSQDIACADDLHIQNIGNSNQQENQYLFFNAFEPCLAGQLFIYDGICAEHIGDKDLRAVKEYMDL